MSRCRLLGSHTAEAEAGAPSIQAVDVDGSGAGMDTEAERLAATWAARGIHTPSVKQAVWEIMSSRSIKDTDLLAAGFPNVEIMGATKEENARTPIQQLRRWSVWRPGRAAAPGGRVYGRVYRWTSPANHVLEALLLLLILANVASVVIDAMVDRADDTSSFAHDDDRTHSDTEYEIFETLELSSTVFFTIEYLVRLWSCSAHPRFAGNLKGRAGFWCNWMVGRCRFAKQPLMILDAVALVPFYLDIFLENGFRLFGNQHKFRGGLVLRALRLLRLISLLRLERQLRALQILAQVFRSRSNELLVTAYALLSLTLLGGVLGYYFEASTKNPDKNITSLSESLYWCIVTITTVGYGDLHPVSTGGKILSMFISLAGVLMFALPAGILGSGFVEVMQQHLQHEEEEQSKQIARLIVLMEQLSEDVKSNQARVEDRLTATESRLGTQRGGS